jgi:glucose dehydrogenase
MFNNTIEKMLNVFIGADTAPTGTLKVALMNGYTFTETHSFWSDVSASEASGTGYTSGGQAVDNVTVTQSDANDGAYLDHDDEVFSSISVTSDGAIWYWDTGTPSTSLLLQYDTFSSGSQTVTSGSITVTPPATGILLASRA